MIEKNTKRGTKVKYLDQKAIFLKMYAENMAEIRLFRGDTHYINGDVVVDISEINYL